MSDSHTDELLRQFEDCSLPLDRFRHRVHIQIPFLYLRKYPALDVLRRFPEALKRYADAHGKTGLYHETITWAYILLIQERMQRAPQVQTWEEFAATNEDLLTWSGTILSNTIGTKRCHPTWLAKSFCSRIKLPRFPERCCPLAKLYAKVIGSGLVLEPRGSARVGCQGESANHEDDL